MNYQKKVKVISTKWIAKNVTNWYTILNGAKYFSSSLLQNCLVFIPAKKYFKFLVALPNVILGNLMECQKKILKI